MGLLLGFPTFLRQRRCELKAIFHIVFPDEFLSLYFLCFLLFLSIASLVYGHFFAHLYQTSP